MENVYLTDVTNVIGQLRLFHATFNSYLPSIKENGLIPGKNHNWLRCISGFVYLANSLDAAISFCETSEDTPLQTLESGICCFEVDLNKLEFSKLQIDPNISFDENESPWSFAYEGNIPYAALLLCYEEKNVDLNGS